MTSYICTISRQTWARKSYTQNIENFGNFAERSCRENHAMAKIAQSPCNSFPPSSGLKTTVACPK